MRLIPLDEKCFVAGQIGPDDMAEIAAAGVTVIVNNRPDHEEPGQPTGEEIGRAAASAGLAYRDIAIAGFIPPDKVAAMAAAIGEADGKLLLFCRSGTRSTWLWALASAHLGADPDTLVTQAAAAGYDLTPLRASLVP